MIDYEDMSDLEINKLVAGHNGFIVADEDSGCYNYNYREKYPSTIWVAKHEFGNQIEPWEQFNFVLCPSDAWPIMKEYGIATICEDGKLIGATTNSQEYYEPYGSKIFSYEDENPLRAAMICFLKMKDAQNDHN